MKRILVFGITENPGGVESVIMNYYRKLDRSRFELEFLCNTSEVAYEDEILALGGQIYRVPARRDGRKEFYQALDGFFAEQKGRFDAIWVNVCSLANIDYLKYAKKYGIPRRIIHSHNAQNGDSFLRGLIHKKNRYLVERYATDFWYCSDEARDWFYTGRIQKKQSCRCLCNAIDPGEYAFSEEVRRRCRRELGIDSRIVIGHVGRFHFQKNQSFLLDILKCLKEKEDRFLLLFAGQGEEEEKVRQKAEKLGLLDSVLFLGVRKDVADLYNAMDLFVFPSLFEGLPMTLLEVQANGLPVLLSDTIAKETVICPNAFRMDLKAGAEAWAEKLLSMREEEKRADRACFEGSRYDICSQMDQFASFFESQKALCNDHSV